MSRQEATASQRGVISARPRVGQNLISRSPIGFRLHRADFVNLDMLK